MFLLLFFCGIANGIGPALKAAGPALKEVTSEPKAAALAPKEVSPGPKAAALALIEVTSAPKAAVPALKETRHTRLIGLVPRVYRNSH